MLLIDRRTVYQMIYEKRIPYLKAAGRVLFDTEEIEAWLRRHRKAS